MNFEWTGEQVAFRARVRAFLDANLPDDWGSFSRSYDTGSDRVEEFARAFCPKLADEGLLVPHWPVAFGGQGLDAWHHWILNEEMFAIGEPRSYQYMSVNWAGPALMQFGSPEQKAEHLQRIAAGKLFYCQGFSEPNAGSDLPALTTRAEQTASGFLINGSKIWTSAASFADYCFLLARTGGPGRRGISLLLVSMDSPGITVNVIKGLQGQKAFHEVFFENVEVPAGAVLGEVDAGWTVVSAILHNERIGAPRYSLTIRGLDRALEILREEGRAEAPGVKAAAVLARAACEAARLQCYRVIDGRVKGRPASAETNLARYAIVSADRMVAEFLVEHLGNHVVSGADPIINAAYRRAGSSGIAAGAAEVQLNAIARNLLDLPVLR